MSTCLSCRDTLSLTLPRVLFAASRAGTWRVRAGAALGLREVGAGTPTPRTARALEHNRARPRLRCLPKLTPTLRLQCPHADLVVVCRYHHSR